MKLVIVITDRHNPARHSRPIGPRMVKACEAVAALEVATSGQVAADLGIPRSACPQLLLRLVSHGLMTVNRVSVPHQYSMVEGWRSRVQERPAELRSGLGAQRGAAESMTRRAIRTQPNSVFSMGAMT